MQSDLFGERVEESGRSEFDFYESARWQACSLLHFHGRWIEGTRVIEPCSGSDVITNALRDAGCEVLTNDIDERRPSVFHEDASKPEFWMRLAKMGVECEWVVTKPPFLAAFPILCNAFEFARIGVALLLRKTFLEPTKERGGWLEQHPPTNTIGLPRYSFTGDGKSDSVACDWIIWQKVGFCRPAIVIDAHAKERTHWRDTPRVSSPRITG